MAHTYRRAMTVIAVLLVGALWLGTMLTGCSSAEPEATDTTTTYTIGLAAPLTANAVAIGQGVSRGAELAILQFNESEKAAELGINFELREADDQGDPKLGVNVANQLVSDATIVGVVGHVNSGVSVPSSKVYNDSNVVMISPASTSPELTAQGFANVFRTCTTDLVQGPAAANAALGLGYKKAAVIDDSTTYGVGLAAAFADEFTAEGGEVVLTEKTTDKDTDFTALITKVIAADPDVIYFGGIYGPASYFTKQLRTEGSDAVVMGGDALNAAEFIEVAGVEAAEGTLVTGIGYPADQLPAGQEFLAAYAEAFPDDEVAAFDAYAYDAANAIINACIAVIEEVGADKLATPAGREAIVAAVAEVSFEGVTGPVSFDDKGDATNGAVTVFRIEGGQFVPYLLPDQI